MTPLSADGTCNATRPTAINLKWALDEMLAALRNLPRDEGVRRALRAGGRVGDEDVEINKAIGRNGLDRSKRSLRGREGRAGEHSHPLQCGLARLRRWGTATAPIYMAHDAGIRACMGGRDAAAQSGRRADGLGAGPHGVPHTVIADNTGGHLMQHGLVDL